MKKWVGGIDTINEVLCNLEGDEEIFVVDLSHKMKSRWFETQPLKDNKKEQTGWGKKNSVGRGS